MAVEQLILDPVTEDAANSQLDITGTGYGLTEQHYPQPPLAAQWASSVDTEGSRLASVKHENRQIQISLDVESLDLLRALQAKLGKLHREGGTLRRTLTDATVIVFDVLTVEGYDPSFDQAYVLGGITSVSFTLTCLPYGRGPAVANVVDDFSTNTDANYAYDSGSGLSATGGLLVPNSAAQKRKYHLASEFYDAQVTMKITTGASVTNLQAGVMAKRLDASNHLYALILGAGGATGLRIGKRDAGALTTLASGTFTPSVSTSYWLRLRQQGNDLAAELFTAAPTSSSTPTVSVTYTLAGADATKFGQGIKGFSGPYIAAGTTAFDERYDDFTVEPNLYVERTLPVLTITMSGVKGDMPPLGQLVANNDSVENQDLLLWGQQSRYYSAASTAALFYQAESCALISATATAGPVGASGTVARNTSLAAGPSSWTSLHYIGASSTAQTHIGTFRIFARVQAANTNTGTVSLRVQYSPVVGARLTSTEPVDLASGGSPVEATWALVDLGMVSLPPVVTGTQGWIGILQANSTVAGDDLDVDWVMLVPVDEGSGQAFDDTYPPGPAGGHTMIRHDSALGSTAGSYWWRINAYEGDYLFLPPAGTEGRTLRIIVKYSRGEKVDGSTFVWPLTVDEGTDDISAQVFYTPRYLVVPAA